MNRSYASQNDRKMRTQQLKISENQTSVATVFYKKISNYPMPQKSTNGKSWKLQKLTLFADHCMKERKKSLNITLLANSICIIKSNTWSQFDTMYSLLKWYMESRLPLFSKLPNTTPLFACNFSYSVSIKHSMTIRAHRLNNNNSFWGTR